MPDFIATLDSRRVLSVSGRDAEQFLQGLLTNDVSSGFSANPGAAHHTALLSPQGKILSDFFLISTAGGYLIDVSADSSQELLKRLKFYKLRADVAIEECPEYRIVATNQPEVITAFNPVVSFRDPRFEPMGYRFIATTENISGTGASMTSPLDDENAYHRHRIHLGVPEGGMDFAFGSVFPHDVSMDVLHGVHFQKGCFIGQEVVSRMQHRQKNRKSIVRVKMPSSVASQRLSNDGDQLNLTTSEGRKIGTLGSIHGQEGLAIIRIDHAQKAIADNTPILIDDTEVELVEPAWAAYQLRSGA